MPTAEIAASIADERGIDAPIIDAVNDLLGGRTVADVRDAVAALMSRPLRDLQGQAGQLKPIEARRMSPIWTA